MRDSLKSLGKKANFSDRRPPRTLWIVAKLDNLIVGTGSTGVIHARPACVEVTYVLMCFHVYCSENQHKKFDI